LGIGAGRLARTRDGLHAFNALFLMVFLANPPVSPGKMLSQ